MSSPKRLTAAAVRAAKARERTYDIYDTGGLYVTVASTGAKWWRLRYQKNGKSARVGLGAFPSVSLREARAARDRAAVAIRAGVDPGDAQRSAENEAKAHARTTFELVVREWLAFKECTWTTKRVQLERRCFELHALPWIGQRAVRSIRSPDIRKLLDRLIVCGSIDQAHRLRRSLNSVFGYASCDGRVERNPAEGLQHVMPKQTRSQYCAVSEPADVAALLHAIDRFNGYFATLCALKLSALVFLRPAEVRLGEWQEVDFDAREWRIPPARMKMASKLKRDIKTRPHVVPLADQAIEILRDLRALTGEGRYLFPSVKDKRRPMADATISGALRRLGYDRDAMTPHGFRHMASTMLNELGWHPDAIERQLAHRAQGVRAVYNRAEHMPERRDMMQAWADYLDALRASEAPYVKPPQRLTQSAIGRVTTTTETSIFNHDAANVSYSLIVISTVTTRGG